VAVDAGRAGVPRLAPGTRVERFTVQELIGAGGMGEVYRARDERLHRDVALKVLPERFAGDQRRVQRFVREARIAGSLNHPNVVAIHDFGVFEGMPFAVAELLHGESLRQRLNRGVMTPGMAIEIGQQVARGLEAAHRLGVVHRDLKPENVFITGEGVVKLLDFGVARLSDPDPEACPAGGDGDTADEPVEVAGTAGYMAPEQVRGEPGDHRTDIFALGAVLYEMMTGKRAFSGPTRADVISAVLLTEPPPFGARVPGAWAALERVVLRCLEKLPEARFHSAHDVGLALQAVSAGAVPARSPRRRRSIAWAALLIAVAALAGLAGSRLGRSGAWPGGGAGSRSPAAARTAQVRLAVSPLADLSRPPRPDLAAEVTANLVARLAEQPGLVVVSPDLLAGGGAAESPGDLGRRLGADAVVVGTVRAGAGGEVHVTVRAVAVRDGANLAARSFSGSLAAALAEGDAVARLVAAEAGAAPAPSPAAGSPGAPAVSPDAYQAYLRARGLLRQPWGERSRTEAIRLLEEAVLREPGFALAHAELAHAHASLYSVGGDRSSERLELASRAAQRALELDGGSPEVRLRLAYYRFYSGHDDQAVGADLAAAEQDLAGAFEVLELRGLLLERRGDFERALAILQRALELNPGDAALAGEIGAVHVRLGWPELADWYLDRSIDLQPDQLPAYGWKVFNCWRWKGSLSESRHILASMPYVDDPDDATLLWYLQDLYERDYEAALAVAANLPGGAVVSRVVFQPAAYLEAQALELAGRGGEARAAWVRARDTLEAELAMRPDDARVLSSLARVYAAFGQYPRALAAARRAVQLVPSARDACFGPQYELSLAATLAAAGDADGAVGLLERLAENPPFQATPVSLRLDPRWRALRDHPRFAALLTRAGGDGLVGVAWPPPLSPARAS